MRRVLLLLVKLAVVVALAVWVANNPGWAEVTWLGYTIEMPFGILLLGVLVVVAILFGLWRVWHGLVMAPRSFGRYRAGSRRDQGFRALTAGMVSVAAGDPDSARRYAKKADQLLEDPPLTMLLSAQAAQLTGDETAARKYFEAMLRRPETEFLGLRGLLTQALKDGDRPRALQLARRAKKINPETPWLLETSFDLEVHQRRWADALITLHQMVKAGVLGADVAKHHKGAILVEQSREAESDGRPAEALELAHKAVQLVPDFTPAAVREARLLLRQGKDRAARKAVEKAWERNPHRELAEVWRRLGSESERMLERVKRYEKLVKLTPDSPVAHAALGEVALEAELWGQARSHLTTAVEKAPDRRLYRMLADLEERENGDAAAARDWLAKAESAPSEAVWTCQDCGTPHPVWNALCPTCGAFDRMAWKGLPPAMVLLPADGDGPMLEARSGPTPRDAADDQPADAASAPPEAGATRPAATSSVLDPTDPGGERARTVG
jgi:HemY protein